MTAPSLAACSRIELSEADSSCSRRRDPPDARALRGAATARAELSIDQEAHLRAPQHGVIVLAGRKLEHGTHVIGLKVGVVGEDLLSTGPRGKQVEHVFYSMRSPRIHGRPPQTFGSIVIRSIALIGAPALFQHSAILARPTQGPARTHAGPGRAAARSWRSGTLGTLAQRPDQRLLTYRGVNALAETSSASTRPRSSAGSARGGISSKSSLRRWSGSTGSTSGGSSGRLVMCRPRSTKRSTMQRRRGPPWRRDSSNQASHEPGAIQGVSRHSLGRARRRDFFTIEVWTPRGLTRFTVLVLIHLASRRVQIAGISVAPDGPWVTQLLRNATDVEDGFLRNMRFLIHDRDPQGHDLISVRKFLTIRS